MGLTSSVAPLMSRVMVRISEGDFRGRGAYSCLRPPRATEGWIVSRSGGVCNQVSHAER